MVQRKTNSENIHIMWTQKACRDHASLIVNSLAWGEKTYLLKREKDVAEEEDRSPRHSLLHVWEQEEKDVASFQGTQQHRNERGRETETLPTCPRTATATVVAGRKMKKKTQQPTNSSGQRMEDDQRQTPPYGSNNKVFMMFVPGSIYKGLPAASLFC